MEGSDCSPPPGLWGLALDEGLGFPVFDPLFFSGSCVFRVKCVHNTWVPPSKKLNLALEEGAGTGCEGGRPVRGAEKKPLPTVLCPGQQKKQTTVNAATRAAHEAGAHTQGRAGTQRS